MSARHTPGPWNADDDFEIRPDQYEGKDNTQKFALIASVSPWRGNPHDQSLIEQAKGNLALIAAAPELLDVLEAIVRHSDAVGPLAEGPYILLASDLERARAALEKTRGAQ